MSVLEDAKAVHARWSDVNREFMEFAGRNPECLRREDFEALHRDTPSLRRLAVQPWPFFVGPERWGELEAIALGMDRLMKGALERLFARPAARVVEFYRSNGNLDGTRTFASVVNEGLVTSLLKEPDGLRGALSRGDYVETREGLKCVECNFGGSLGGLETDDIARLHLRSACTARFLREQGRRVHPPGAVRALYRHVVEDTERLGAWTGGEFNAAVVVRPNSEAWLPITSAEAHTRALRGALEESGRGTEGEVFLCAYDELVEGPDGITFGGRSVHAVVDQHNGQGDTRAVFRAFKARRLNWFGGPMTYVLTDKRNLTLVSEHAGSDNFTAAERDLIERHVPWTRRILPSRTTFRGRGFTLPDDLAERREELVLKKGVSSGGEQVVVGRFRTDAEWKEILARAVREGDWVVQEHLEMVPYRFQSGEEGAPPHGMVWGLMAFGNHFGGVYLRVHPSEGHDGVVNTRRGAELGVALRVAE